jgi:hypothetical protein
VTVVRVAPVSVCVGRDRHAREDASTVVGDASVELGRPLGNRNDRDKEDHEYENGESLN